MAIAKDSSFFFSQARDHQKAFLKFPSPDPKSVVCECLTVPFQFHKDDWAAMSHMGWKFAQPMVDRISRCGFIVDDQKGKDAYHVYGYHRSEMSYFSFYFKIENKSPADGTG